MRASTVAVTLAAIGSVACSDTSGPAAPAALEVSLAIQGTALNSGSYMLAVDNLPSVPVNPGAALITPVDAGRHDVRMTGVTGNCKLVGSDRAEVEALAGDTVEVVFQVDCTLGGIRAIVTTTGLDDPDGYTLDVDARGDTIPVGSNDSASWSGLPPGRHTVQLGRIAQHCSVQGPAAQDVTVATGETAPLAFTVVCGASYGVIGVTVAASGEDVGNLKIAVDGRNARGIGPDEHRFLDSLALGTHAITVWNDIGTCRVESQATLVGGPTRDTVEIAFINFCRSLPILHVTAPTTGTDRDDAYLVTVTWNDGEGFGFSRDTTLALAAAGTVTYKGEPGDYRLTLVDVASNCTITAPNPTPLYRMAVGDTLDVKFPVTCSRRAAEG